MFDTSFHFVYLGNFASSDKNIERILKFRFKTQNGNVYIIDVENYKNNIYIIKYYLKNHRLSEYKYSFRTNENVANRIFGTCLNVASEILNKDCKASFGYVGANDIDEKKENTKRYRVYKRISERFFSPKNFTHYQNDKNSLYLMLNNSNSDLEISTILKLLATNYEIIF